MEEKDEEEIVELPKSMVEAFQQKLSKGLENEDIPLSPISEKKKKRRPKSSNVHCDAFKRLYVSPSPFKSPKEMRK